MPEQQQVSTTPIVPPSNVQNRLNLADLVPSGRRPGETGNPNLDPKNQKFWTLYIRALYIMQRKNEEDPNSYFQIAAIHGYPFIEWAKCGDKPVETAKQFGYCTHSQVLFPTWHRIYSLAFEQALGQAAQEALKKFKVANPQEKQAWAEAARDLRQPYWDWADKLRDPPRELFEGETVEIINYDGKTPTKVPNPLLRYYFPSDFLYEHKSAEDENPKGLDESLRKKLETFAVWDRTLRNPDINGKEDVKGLFAKFKREGGSTRYKTLMMLLHHISWEYFSNNGMRYDKASPHSSSLEAVHDDIHMFAGKGHSLNGVFVRAHMTDLAFAAFDPIFWLHHANVDRLLSLWQAIHPGVWVSKGSTREPTMAFALDEEVDINSPLEPFYQASGKPWTSDLLIDTAKLGYSYPDFDKTGPPTLADFQNPKSDKALTKAKTVTDRVEQLYGYRLEEDETNEALKLFAEFSGKRQRPLETLEMYDWGVHASFEKYQVQDSFSLIFYFADGARWDDDDHYIGSVNAFHGLTPDTCANCKKQENLVQEGYVHLTYFLARSAKTENAGAEFFDPDQVIKYLQQRRLTCKIDGADVTKLSSLQLTLQGRLMRLEPNQELPNPDAQKVVKYPIHAGWTEFRMLTGAEGIPARSLVGGPTGTKKVTKNACQNGQNKGNHSHGHKSAAKRGCKAGC